MLVWGAIELAVPLSSLGLLPLVQQYLPRIAHAGGQAGLRRFVLHVALLRYGLIVLACVLVLGYWPVTGSWLGLPAESTHAGLVFCLLMAAVVAGRFAAEMLEALLEQRDAQLARALNPVLRVVGLAALWAGGWLTLESLLWLDLGVSLFTWLLAQWWLRAALRRLQPDRSDSLDWSEMRRFLAYMSGAQLLQAAGSVGAVRLVVGRVLGVEAAGVFGFLQQIVMIANRYMPSLLLANVVRPMLIARLRDGRAEDVAVGFGLLWKVNLLLGVGLLAIVVVGGDGLLALASGGRVLGGGWPMAFMMVSLFFMGQNQVVSMAMQVYGYLVNVLAVSALAPLVLPFAVVGGRLGGLVGVAAAVAAAVGVRSIVSTVLLQRRAGRMRRDGPGAGRAALALLVAAAMSWGIGRWLGPVAAAACLPLLSLPLLWLARPLHPLEAALLSRGAGRWGQWVGRWTSR